MISICTDALLPLTPSMFLCQSYLLLRDLPLTLHSKNNFWFGEIQIRVHLISVANENGGLISKSRGEEIIDTHAQRDCHKAIQHPAYLTGERYSNKGLQLGLRILDSGLLRWFDQLLTLTFWIYH